MHTPNSRPRDDSKPVRPWWEGVHRIYLDATVFEGSDALRTLLEQVLPDVLRLHALNSSARLVVHESTREQLKALAGSPSDEGLQAAAQAVKDALSRLTCVEWLPAGLVANQAAESAIVTACVRGQSSCQQVVFTQSADLAQRVEANSRSPSHRGAIRVHARCVLANGHMSWSDYAGMSKGSYALSVADLSRFSRFLVDTCSFMLVPHAQRGMTDGARLHYSGLRLLDRLLPIARASGARIVVPQEVRDELQTHADGKAANQNVSESAQVVATKALAWMDRSDMRELIDVLPRMHATGHADPAILAWLAEVGPTRDVCVITQDTHLLADLIGNLPKPPRFSRVCRVNDRGDVLFDRLREYQARLREDGKQSPGEQTPDKPAGPKPIDVASPEGPSPQAPTLTAAPAHTPPISPAATASAPPTVQPTVQPHGAKSSDGPRPETGSARPPRQPGSAVRLPAKPLVTPSPARRPWLVAAVAAIVCAAALALAWPTREIPLRLVADGRPVSMSGDTALLPVGTRFTVQVVSPSEGSVEILAFNASQPRDPVVLMHARVMPGETVVSPVLRVEPGPGIDRLDVVLLPGDASKTVRSVYIRHQ